MAEFYLYVGTQARWLELLRNSTAERTNIELGSIDHIPCVSVVVIKDDCFNLHFLTEENHFLLKQKPAVNLPTSKNSTSLGCKMTFQLALNCTIFFCISSQSAHRRYA